MYLEPLWFVLFGVVAIFFLWPRLKVFTYRLNADADELIETDQLRRQHKRTALVDVTVARALQMKPKDLHAYGRRNWGQLLTHEGEIVSQMREVLGDSEKVRFLQELGELETVCQPLFALKSAKQYAAKDGKYRDRRRRELQKAELLALRKRLIEHYGLGTGSRRRGLLAGLDLNQLPSPKRHERR
jgi:hypothetical protein